MTDALHYPTEEINVEELGVGTHLIFKPANEARFLRWYVFSEMRYGVTFAFAFDYSCISGNEQINVNCTPETLMDNTSYNLIDSKNYSFRTPIGTVFVILDTSILEEDRRALYPEIGIYLQVSNDSTRTERYFTLKVFKFVKLSEAYIPITIARTDYVDKKITETIPTPATASVGQTIKVSAIDENGKPTAWETADFPEVNTGRILAQVTFTEETTGVTVTNLNADVTELSIIFKTTTSAYAPTLSINNHKLRMYTGSWDGQCYVFAKIDKKAGKLLVKSRASNGGVNVMETNWEDNEIVESIGINILGFAANDFFNIYEGLTALLLKENYLWLP